MVWFGEICDAVRPGDRAGERRLHGVVGSESEPADEPSTPASCSAGEIGFSPSGWGLRVNELTRRSQQISSRRVRISTVGRGFSGGENCYAYWGRRS